ncbi:hypothetical protein I302_101778 [Kwoniella bestiolae CBS 10118]|uniref:Uncharacterized protein n=1 Tax=Kwoniella bestiolae CBS 10118 TaxID=1296100 RepID=A0A1B9GD94_9TREE|nr:hypothetical protein I302_00458 [Kwoniella bestiolae CBS 10118]OCF28967.1 hypothetical protein I302_00458 [Kwoniella bestiolae CBS 10118]
MRSLSLALILTTLASLGSTAAFSPSETQPQLAPRTFQSNGMTCYSECPATRGTETFNGKSVYQDRYSDTRYYICSYTGGSNCYFNPDGSLRADNPLGNTTPCPQQAPTSGCGTPDSPARAFKRSIVRRQTTAEKRLAARQYKPKRVKSTAA